MKYMGSKRRLINGELGKILRQSVKETDDFVDLFSGSGAVSWFVASELHARVTAVDLQHYSGVLSSAVIERTHNLPYEHLVSNWLNPYKQIRDGDTRTEALTLDKNDIFRMREEAEEDDDLFVRAYAGYYLSPYQAATFHWLRDNLPENVESRASCLSAVIMSVIDCCASPGHTAQPLNPSNKTLPYFHSVWSKDPVQEVSKNLRLLTKLHSKKKGKAVIGDANSFAARLKGHEVVFLDPPYSSVQYSRFYHVLEAVAVGGYDEVYGTGRMPIAEQRPQSKYSLKRDAHRELLSLLSILAEKECTVIVTFPEEKASNGISGKELQEEASQLFSVTHSSCQSSFSSLGGAQNGTREARRQRTEMILKLEPKNSTTVW